VVDVKGGDAEADQRPKKTAGMNSGTSTLSLSGNGSREWAERGTAVETVGWRPGRVLDPFAGSGRTGIEALRLGLDFVGVELNPSYADMARRLLHSESPLFAGGPP
jgi:adenine-specific DNA methylase